MSGRVTVHAVARSTTTDHRGAIDAEITVGGCRGEVTLIRHDASGDLDTWGPDWGAWADDEVQAALSATPEGERRALIDEIVQAVSAAGGQALSDRLAREAEDEDDGEDEEEEEDELVSEVTS